MSSMGEYSCLTPANTEDLSGKALVPPQEKRVHIQGIHNSGSEFSCKNMIHGYVVVFNLV